MAELVVMGAMLKCTFGAAPSTFMPTPGIVSAGKMMAGTIMDFVPMTNIMPFGMCMTQSNPAVAAATAAALGVPTPAPCVPATVAPWIPGVPAVLVEKKPALDKSCTLMCVWGGSISVTNAGQVLAKAT